MTRHSFQADISREASFGLICIFHVEVRGKTSLFLPSTASFSLNENQDGLRFVFFSSGKLYFQEGKPVH